MDKINAQHLKTHKKYMKIYVRLTEVLDELEAELAIDNFIDDRVMIQAKLIRVLCTFDLTGLIAHVINLQEFIKSQLSHAEGMRQHLKENKDIRDFKP